MKSSRNIILNHLLMLFISGSISACSSPLNHCSFSEVSKPNAIEFEVDKTIHPEHTKAIFKKITTFLSTSVCPGDQVYIREINNNSALTATLWRFQPDQLSSSPAGWYNLNDKMKKSGAIKSFSHSLNSALGKIAQLPTEMNFPNGSDILGAVKKSADNLQLISNQYDKYLVIFSDLHDSEGFNLSINLANVAVVLFTIPTKKDNAQTLENRHNHWIEEFKTFGAESIHVLDHERIDQLKAIRGVVE